MEFEEISLKLCDEREFARENFVPIIRDQSAKYLYEFVKKNNFKNILEIGTAIGYSGSIILSATNANLTTIDINENYLERAKSNFEKLGFNNRVEIFHDDAWVIINKLLRENRKFDMIFLDGAKGQYVKYLDVLTSLLEDNGVIFADNVLLGGMVESDNKIPHRKRTMVVNLRKYLEIVNSEKYQTELIRLEDGIAITKLKGEK